MKIGKKGAVGKELTRAERNRRNNLRRTLISAAVAFVLFIALTVIQGSILNQEKKDTVYQVIKDIDINTRITEENFNEYFKLKEVQISLIPNNYITEKSQIIGKYIKREYKVNDIVTTAGVRDVEREYKESIKNPIEISFDISSLGSGVAGTLREGDFINIYGISRGDGDNAGGYVLNKELTFEKVYIAAAFDGSGNRIRTLDISDSNTVTMLTLIIAEEDAAKFTEMLSNCQIHVAKIIYELDENKETNNTEQDTVVKEEETTKIEEETTTKKEEQTSTEEQTTITSGETTITSGETGSTEIGTTGIEEETTTDRDVTIPTGGNGNSSDLGGIFN